MGTYLNPGNEGFSMIVKGDYVDKTGMISLVNSTIGTTKSLCCISRPRRFGKSYAAQMLCAYYDRSCDSHELFDHLAIAGDSTYEKHLNQYHVISLDISGFVSAAKRKGISLSEVPDRIEKALLAELAEAGQQNRESIYFQENVRNTGTPEPEMPGFEIQGTDTSETTFTEQKTTAALIQEAETGESLTESIIRFVKETRTKIVFIIDEWDSMIRETKYDREAQERYLNLLREWFKNNNFTPTVVAAAFMTGILPIKKDGSQSAISDFQEYTMLDPLCYAKYVGFTGDEVRELCRNRGASFERMKKWFDGYTVGDFHSIYNPYSVMQTLASGKYRSYWKKTSAAETLKTYIDMDEDGLQEDIARLSAGEEIVVDTDSFQNDVETFTCKDDVLTLLVHLGYLTYEEISDSDDHDDEEPTGVVRIPNEEVRTEFKKMLRRATHKDLIRLIRKSDQLLKDTLAQNAEAVASAIQEIHDSEYAPTFYNDEQSLRYVVKFAYISCVDQYAKVEELPSGRGIADVAFIPKRRSPLPAMIVELKWNQSSGGAIAQILEKGYHKVFEKYGGDVILAGISYDRKSKKHECRITRLALPL